MQPRGFAARRECGLIVLRTSIAARAAALAASAIVHATAFAVAPGHARRDRDAGVDPAVEVAVDTQDDVPARAKEIEPPAPDANTGLRAPPQQVAPSHDWTPHDPAPIHVRALAPTAQAASTVTAPTSEPAARFTIVVGDARRGSGGAVSARERSGAPGEAEPIAAERATTPARLLTGAPLEYPARARAEGTEANVILELVVDTGGRVTSARVARSAAPSFDEAALGAVRNYRFAPAALDGRAVSVRMRWSVEFRLR
jgi:protein TonB